MNDTTQTLSITEQLDAAKKEMRLMLIDQFTALRETIRSGDTGTAIQWLDIAIKLLTKQAREAGEEKTQ